jgi:hypothetical protein
MKSSACELERGLWNAAPYMASFQQVTAKRHEIQLMSASMRTQVARLLTKAGRPDEAAFYEHPAPAA